ncbi:hypothetical protein EG349_08750 [Chryseobacterium shandongense]|uniref:SdiA-regulated family protein n=1 Tax=Chryseobacterium shandongense TaxID=1493872 RepID=A0AAD1DN33_9FLAO|nr:hypothetical protein [Chryseobacterium shandongense]AZA86869.1 hypothetical protein EG349_08750 [Chryseobacterium shandongense]AZA95285.1 hypothetical protein EG353_06800 [Chryseobacterium shandongense]
MLRVLVLSAFLVLSCNPKAQDSPKSDALSVEFALPKKLKEISGIALSKDKNTIWAIEDQGNKNVIYGLDRQGKQIADVLVENAENRDWEDITADAQGNMYIGDFGNNDNDRQDLSILKVDLKEASQKAAKVTQTTTFHYEGQTEFPPKKSNWLYDCEAFVEKDGYFYLFTKNRSKGFDGTFLVFQVPNKAGDFEAKLVAKLKLQGGYSDAAITSAAINSRNQIILLTHKNIYMLSTFFDKNFETAVIQKTPLNHNSQKEAVVFLDDKTLLIADEKDGKEGGNVYKFSLK